LCNVYPKIFGEDTADVTFNDIEIHEATDIIVSGGGIKDATVFPTSDSYPILIVSSLSTTNVKWAVTDKTMSSKETLKVTVSPKGNYIASMIGKLGSNYRVIVFNANDGKAISSREFVPDLWYVPTRELRALLINSDATSGFVMDSISSGFGTKLFKYNPMSST
jgi:hypothetical protein